MQIKSSNLIQLQRTSIWTRNRFVRQDCRLMFWRNVSKCWSLQTNAVNILTLIRSSVTSGFICQNSWFFNLLVWIHKLTRMHSSMIRTVRLLIVSRIIRLGRICPTPPMCPPHSPVWTDKDLWKHNLQKIRLWAVKIWRRKKIQYYSKLIPIQAS